MTSDPLKPRPKAGMPKAGAPDPLPTQCPHGWEFLPPPFDARQRTWLPLRSLNRDIDGLWGSDHYTMSVERITDNEPTDECEWALRIRDGDGGTYTLASGTREECQAASRIVRAGV